MSSIDPSISLQVRPPAPSENPIEAYGKVMALKNLMTQGRIQQQQLQMGKLQQEHETLLNKEDERKVAANQAMSQAIQANSSIDQNTGEFKIDHDKVEAMIMRAGYPDKALEYTKSRKEVEDAMYSHATQQLDLASKKNEQFGKMAQTVLNAPQELRAGVYGFTLKNAMSSGLLDQKTMADRGIPAQYQGAQTDQLLQSISDYASKDPAKELRDRMASAREQKEFENKQPGEIAEAQRKQVELASRVLGNAKTQTDWDNARSSLPPSVKAMYPEEFSENARQQAAMSGVSPDTRATLARYTSATELQYAANRGDRDAARALKDLEDREIRIESAKKVAEMNAMFGLGGATAPLPGQTPQAPAPGARGLNEDFLSKLNPGLAAEVRGMAQGKIPFPSGMGSTRLQPLIRLVEQYDPSFDATNYQNRMKTREDFANGKAAGTNNALNTVIQHLDRLSGSVDGLSNFGEGVPTAVNSLKNWAKENLGYSAKLNKFRDDVEAVASEATRAWRGAGGSEKDIQDWKKNMSSSDSPQGLRASIAEIGDLLEGKVAAQQRQYDQAMGPMADLKVLSPDSEHVLARLGVGGRTPPAASRYGDPRITEDIMAKARAANKGVSDAVLVKAIRDKLDGVK